MAIAALIDKQDSFEIVRDQIAAILAIETASQQALAVAGGKDPNLWKFDVYTERSQPWEKWLNDQSDLTPIVNVGFQDANFNERASDQFTRQQATGTFHIDCYGVGISQSDGGTGHIPGDRAATVEAHRILRLIRNIIKAEDYAYLGLMGNVSKVWISRTEVFTPLGDGTDNVLKVVPSRLVLEVTYNEFSPQVVGETLEYLSATVKRSEDGSVIATADYDYTAP